MNRTISIVTAMICGSSTVLHAEWNQWNAGAGHNGHYYKAVAVGASISWSNASAAAEATGGYLACVGSEQENQFIFSLITSSQYWNGAFGPWIGGIQTNKTTEPGGAWSWRSGEDWNYSNWGSGQPDNWLNAEDYVHYWPASSPTWNDMNNDPDIVVAYVIEHEAPVLTGLQMQSVNAVLELGNLIVGMTTTVQRSQTLTPVDWTNAHPFVAVATSTNVTIVSTNPVTFFRVVQE
jgi:hypothetical protein